MIPEPLTIRSHLPHLQWPGLPSTQGGQLLALLYQLEQTQWWSPTRLWQQQQQQLQQLLNHAYQTVPFYQQRLSCTGFSTQSTLTWETWQELPFLTRQELRQAGESLCSNDIPEAHGPLGIAQTSGSTGEPVKVYNTGLTNLFWQALTLRDHYWHQRNFQGKLAVIRVFTADLDHGIKSIGKCLPTWGNPVNILYDTGPAATLDLRTDIKQQISWLQQENPDYLLTYPSNLEALLAYSEENNISLPKLKEVRTIGEMFTPQLRNNCQRIWGVPIIDAYSSQEVGYMALQCPTCDQYHIQSETVLLEVLNQDNQPCQPGDIGRIVVTSLHNFATPLIRYEIQDYAQVGYPCACGRGLPSLARIIGRQRNMVTLPTGETHWPLTGNRQFNDIAPIRQYQFVQTSLTTIDVRLVVERPIMPAEEIKLQTIIHKALGYPFTLNFTYPATLPQKANGKFEEFISEIS